MMNCQGLNGRAEKRACPYLDRSYEVDLPSGIETAGFDCFRIIAYLVRLATLHHLMQDHRISVPVKGGDVKSYCQKDHN